MNPNPLKYLSEARLIQLKNDVSENRDRYKQGDFVDLAKENGWEIDSSLVTIDPNELAKLDGEVLTSNGRVQTAEVDAKNSVIIYNALHGMTPALAMEERVWARLTHIECINYTRDRWFYRTSSYDDEQFDKHVRLHYFASTLTGVRDDNSISRLWWNMHIATMLSPASPEEALGFILTNADVRSNLVERSWTGARLPLSRAIIRMIENEPWLTAHENNFREFMKTLNRDGGGILLEALPDAVQSRVSDEIMDSCLKKAKVRLGA